MNAPPLPAGCPKTGRCALDLTVCVGADGRSRLAARDVSFPWSLGRGYSSGPNDPVMLIPQVAGAGLLAGDHVRQRICVGSNAALYLASAGAMLTYGTHGGGHSVSDWSVDLDAGARAFLVSEPYVLLDDAKLDLRQTLTVAPDATLIGCEGIVCAKAGNRSQWQTETLVRRPDGTRVFTDRQRASPKLLARQADLPGTWTAFGTVLILTPAPDVHLATIRGALDNAAAGLWIGASPIRANAGACVRIAAKNGQLLRSAMRAIVAKCMSVVQSG